MTATDERVMFPVPGPDGDLLLEGALRLPGGATPVAGVVVCHPHPLRGGDMHNNVVEALCEGLELAGIASLRFNFRGVGRSGGVHGHGEAELDDVRAALAYLAARPEVDAARCALAGYSFGARAALRVAGDAGVPALLCVAPPMREPVAEVAPQCPMLVVVGSQDQVLDNDPAAYAARLPDPAALQVVQGTNHFWGGFEPVLVSVAREFFGKHLAGAGA